MEILLQLPLPARVRRPVARPIPWTIPAASADHEGGSPRGAPLDPTHMSPGSPSWQQGKRASATVPSNSIGGHRAPSTVGRDQRLWVSEENAKQPARVCLRVRAAFAFVCARGV